MGAWSNFMIQSQSPRYCSSTEDHRDATRDFYSINENIEGKIIPDWFFYLMV